MRCFPLRFHLKSKTISVAWLLFHKGPHLQINTLSPHNDKSLPPTAVCSTNAALKSKENWNTYSIGMTHYYVENGRSPFSTIRVKCGGRCHTGRERERGQRPVIANSLMVFSAVCRQLLTPRSGTSLTATKNSVAVGGLTSSWEVSKSISAGTHRPSGACVQLECFQGGSIALAGATATHSADPL